LGTDNYLKKKHVPRSLCFLGKVYQVLFGCLTPGSIGLVSYPVVAEAAVTQANPVAPLSAKDKEISSNANGKIVRSLEKKAKLVSLQV